MFFTYVLKSSSGTFYIGQTNNLEARIKRHNSGKNFYTKSRGHWELVFYKEFQSRKEAMSFEKELKSFKNKKYLLEKINSGSAA